MTIRHILAAGVAAATLGIAGLGAVIPAQAAAQSQGNCLVSVQPYSLTDTSSGDADDHIDAIRACEDKAAGTMTQSGHLVLPRNQTSTSSAT